MKQTKETEVLVVGAGPAGMLAAIRLVEAGIECRIIDRAKGPTTRSYACVLHPRSLELLKEAGIIDSVLESGTKIEEIVFESNDSEVEKVSLSDLSAEFPFAVTLSQATLEQLLGDRFRQISKGEIQWDHRLKRLRQDTKGVVATIDKLCVTGEGYGVAEMEHVVERELEVQAKYVFGEDGPESIVRDACGIKVESLSKAESFILCDAKSGRGSSAIARMFLGESGVGALWALPNNRSRWIVPIQGDSESTGLPRKERKPVNVACSAAGEREVERALREFTSLAGHDLGEIEWKEHATFDFKLARQFGKERCWLAGDAAHTGNPVGMQSMNAGLADATELAETLVQILRHNASPSSLERYEQRRRDEWLKLLSMHLEIAPGKGAPPAIRKHWKHIAFCLPALGDQLSSLMRQLGSPHAAAEHTKHSAVY